MIIKSQPYGGKLSTSHMVNTTASDIIVNTSSIWRFLLKLRTERVEMNIIRTAVWYLKTSGSG